MASVSVFIADIVTAIGRARCPIATVAGTYAVFIVVGMVMVHTGDTFSLTYRDRLVKRAAQQNPAALAASHGDDFQAAMWDFAGNLALGAVPKTVSGLGIIVPYPWVAHQGWVGGIVSVHGDHTSRLDDPRSAVYYLLTLLLQVMAYSLAVGSGINLGWALWRPAPYYQGPKWLGFFPKEALRDVGRLYALAIPLFFVASLWEFLSSWNV